jgi:enterochelin esterase-like enzyme
MLDSLIAAKRIKATGALLFDNTGPPGRIADLANSRRVAAFMADELLPWVGAAIASLMRRTGQFSPVRAPVARVPSGGRRSPLST